MNNKDLSAETKVDSLTEADVTMSSQTIANAPVVGSLSLSKFRGKIMDNKKWAYGLLYRDEDYDLAILQQEYEISDLDGAKDTIFISYKVIPESVGIFIGMTDKEDNEIYTGDILKCYDNAALDASWGLDKQHIGIIEYTAPCFSLKIPGKLDYDGGAVKHWSNDVYLDKWCNAENIEKLGNVFENPELLGSVQ